MCHPSDHNNRFKMLTSGKSQLWRRVLNFMWSFLEVTLPSSSWSPPSPASSGLESAVPSLLGLQKTPRVAFMMSRLQNLLASNGILLYSLLTMFRNRYFKFTAIVCFWAGPETSVIAKLINRQRAPVRESGLWVMMMPMIGKVMMFLSASTIMGWAKLFWVPSEKGMTVMITQEGRLLLSWHRSWVNFLPKNMEGLFKSLQYKAGKEDIKIK